MNRAYNSREAYNLYPQDSHLMTKYTMASCPGAGLEEPCCLMPTTKVRESCLWKVVRSSTLSGIFQKYSAGAVKRTESMDFIGFRGQAAGMFCAYLLVHVCAMKVRVQQNWPVTYLRCVGQQAFIQNLTHCSVATVIYQTEHKSWAWPITSWPFD